MHLRRSLHDAWWRLATQDHPRLFPDALAAGVLSAAASGYATAVALRNAAYDRGWRPAAVLPLPVISVGNLTVGGTGKTACVELVARKLMARGRRVAILTRGYGGAGAYRLRAESGRVVAQGAGAGARLADEPQLLAARLEGVPVFVNPRRDVSGRAAAAEQAYDALILDDGFQHRRVARACDIVLVHARMPLGGWRLLPRGPMREPLTSLRRADIILITKADEALERLASLREQLRSFNKHAAVAAAVHEPSALHEPATGARHDPKRLEGRRVGLLSSIGDPEGFESTVRRLHATVAWHHVLPDHHPYRAADWDAVRARHGAVDAIVTTEKDWVRLKARVPAGEPARTPLWVLGVRMRIIEGEEAFDDRLAAVRAG
jgi:tetraacyldisaccharide 4'-kinase